MVLHLETAHIIARLVCLKMAVAGSRVQGVTTAVSAVCVMVSSRSGKPLCVAHCKDQANICEVPHRLSHTMSCHCSVLLQQVQSVRSSQDMSDQVVEQESYMLQARFQQSQARQ